MKYSFLRNNLRRIGIDISPYPNDALFRKANLLNLYQIDIILDVGASNGGFAKQMRSIGYKGKIVSFEPIPKTFNELKKFASKDKNWIVLYFTLGNDDTEKELNISINYDSSSFLPINTLHLSSNTTSEYFSKEKVIVRKLDSIFDEYVQAKNNVLLKLDVQVFENYVLEGVTQSIKHIKRL